MENGRNELQLWRSVHAEWARNRLASLEQGVTRDALLDAMRREGRMIPGVGFSWEGGR